MRRMIWTACAMAVVAASGAAARGAVIYSYVTDVANVTLAPAGTATLSVYLQESLTAGSTSLLVSEKGLFGAGIQVARTAGPTNAASLLSVVSNPTGADAFTGPGATGNVNATTKFMFEGIAPQATTGAVGTDVNGTRRVLLGTINVQAGTDPGATTFTVSGYQGNTLTFTSGQALDVSHATAPVFTGTGATTTTFTVTTSAVPVPEAASLALLVPAAVMLLRKRRA